MKQQITNRITTTFIPNLISQITDLQSTINTQKEYIESLDKKAEEDQDYSDKLSLTVLTLDSLQQKLDFLKAIIKE